MSSVLIVEDAPDSCEPLAKFLGAQGHTVSCVENGRAALVSVLANVPDVIILDLFTPEMDGPTFLEVIRSYLRLQSLPVVVLTGLPDSPMAERARTLKVNSMLVKGKATLEDIGRAVAEAIPRAPG